MKCPKCGKELRTEYDNEEFYYCDNCALPLNMDGSVDPQCYAPAPQCKLCKSYNVQYKGRKEMSDTMVADVFKCSDCGKESFYEIYKVKKKPDTEVKKKIYREMYDRAFYVVIEESKLKEIDDMEIDDWFEFKKAIHAAGGRFIGFE